MIKDKTKYKNIIEVKGSVDMENKLIYLDNAATTKVRKEVVDAMIPYFTESYGNPSSVYKFASSSKEAVASAKDKISPDCLVSLPITILSGLSEYPSAFPILYAS